MEAKRIAQCWFTVTQFLIAAASLIGLQSQAAETNATRPNIVLILADDLGYSDIGWFGSEISAEPPLRSVRPDGSRRADGHELVVADVLQFDRRTLHAGDDAVGARRGRGLQGSLRVINPAAEDPCRQRAGISR